MSNGGPPRLFHPYLGVRQGDMAQGLDPGRISILWAGVDPRETQHAAIDSQVRTVELGEAFLVDIDELDITSTTTSR